MSTYLAKKDLGEAKYDLAEEPKRKAKPKAEVVAENKNLRAENRELKESKNQMRGMLEKLNRERAEYCHTKTKNPSQKAGSHKDVYS